MKKISCLFLLFFIFFATCVLAAPPTFGPPGIAPDPGGELPVIGSATPNILGTWVGDGKDMQEIFDHGLIHKSSESYTVSLNVWAQEGPIFHAGFAEPIVLDKRIHWVGSGFITDDGEITLFGGYHGVGNEVGSGSIFQIKAKLYKGPNKSIRGFWQSYWWDEATETTKLNSGSFNLHRPSGWED